MRILRKIFFPSINFTAHKRMKFVRYFQSGNIKTVDIACGGGAFSVVACMKGNKVLGLDYDSANIDVCMQNRNAFRIAEEKCEFRQFDVKKIDALNDVFDQVLCFEILEHIIDDNAIVEKIAKITRHGSVLLVSVPNLHHKPIYNETVSDVENGDHVRFGYSFEQLESLLQKHGFEVKKRDSCAGLATQWVTSVEAFLAQKIFQGKMPRWFSAGLFVALYPFTYLDPQFKGEDLSIFVLAEKKY